MKSSTRFILAAIAFIASFFFIYWVPFSLIQSLPEVVPKVIALILALGIGAFTWLKAGRMSTDLASHIVMGGIIVGAIGFIIGFFGPMIFMPGANQGPLLGILITGPIGFVAGLVAGGIVWLLKKKRSYS